MIVQCPQCQAKYRLDEKQASAGASVRVRCTKCGNTFSPPEGASVETELKLPENQKVWLAATAGPLQGQTFPVTQPRVSLGRSNADVIVPDPEISRQHCALEIHGTTATLRDLGSLNGTFVSGEQIEARQISHLTEFRIGATTLAFMVGPKS